MATVNLGKVSFSWKGAYDPTATYNEQDIVNYEGSSYVCTTDQTTGVTPVSNVFYNVNPQTISYVVTVAQDAGGIDRLFIDGVQQQVLTLQRGNTYIFDVSDASNVGHLLDFNDGGVQYTGTGVTRNGTVGTANANVTFVPPLTLVTSSFEYVCANHTGEGASITINSTASNTGYIAASNWDLFAQGVEGITTDPNDILYYDGNQLQKLSAGNVGDVLSVGNDGLPEWSAHKARTGVRVTAINDSRTMMYRRGCALMDDGSVRWWGRGENFMLGQGSYTADRSYPVRTAFPHDAKAIKYICGQYDYQSIAIDVDGGLYVWGQNDYGDCGTGNTSDVWTPYYASGNNANSIYGKVVTDYAPMCSNQNYNSTLVLCDDGTVHAAGYNGYGQIGVGDTTNRSNFVELQLLTDANNKVVQIERGNERYTHCMALREDGNVWSWGYNNNGQLGHGNTTQLNIPQRIQYFVTNNITIKKIGCGNYTSWAIDTNDNLYVWGYNGYGNLGHNGTTTNAVTYSPVLVLTDVANCYMCQADYDFTIARKTDGTLWATGDNSYGCLGVAADTTDRSSFTQCCRNGSTTDYMQNIVKVVHGGTGSYNYAIALDSDGVAWSVGYSGNGQLGRGTSDATNYFYYPVLLNKKIVDICCVGTSSEGGTCFLCDDGSMYQCGYAGESQLPEDDDEYIQTPMPVIF